MFRWISGSAIRGIAALIALVVVLALEYFVPSLPTRITIGAGGKGTTFEYFAEHYRKRFARAGVNLVVRETAGALENLELLKDPNSGVQIGFLTGGSQTVRTHQISRRWDLFLMFHFGFFILPLNRSPAFRSLRANVLL
jgi:hypothetical protein